MTDENRDKEIADEKSFEKKYQDALNGRADDFGQYLLGVVRNSFTEHALNPFPRYGELIGRVALTSMDYSEFYIGDVSHDFGHKRVVSWPSRAAQCVFYRKPMENHVEWCEDVAVVRTFIRRKGKIADFDDEVLESDAVAPYFDVESLIIPKAPSLPIVSSKKPVIENSIEDDGLIGRGKDAPLKGASAPKLKKPGLFEGIRNEPLLQRTLSAPKKASMSAVLSTLQPDQIDLVTRPAPENIILQGHPGTGKTVIAVHRAAFLLHSEYAQAFEENDIEAISKQPRSVLLIGPTNEWVTHVSSALRNLIDDERKFRVVSIAEFENELTGLKTWEGSVEANRLIDVSQELAEIVEFAISRTKSVTKRSYVSRKEVYKTLLDLPANPPAQGLYRDWVDYINGLPRSLSSLNSKRDLSLRPLLAYIGVRTSSTLNFKQFEHVVLDEAQDVYPIQWETLGRLGNPGGWTIVGDLNQRRTDHTYGSWEVVSDLLGLESDDMKPPITVLKVGYRSTSQIIKFADQLLPRNERVIQSVQQSGEKPKVIRETKVTEIPQRVLRETFEMIERVNGGTVAIITVLLDPISKLLVRGGWRKNAVGNSWEEGNRTIQLLTPDQARGIEFDGVVVTEPADFPENLGRSGVLYTSLTRANRLLTVVHNRALPRGMKREV